MVACGPSVLALEPASEPFPAGPIAGSMRLRGPGHLLPLGRRLPSWIQPQATTSLRTCPGPICSGPAVTISGNVWVGNDLGDVYVVEIETLAVEHVAGCPSPSAVASSNRRVASTLAATMEASRSSDRVLRGPCASWPQAGPFARDQSMRRASCGLRTMVCLHADLEGRAAC